MAHWESNHFWVDVSDIFYIFFFCSGRGKGESEVPEDLFFIEDPRRGGGASSTGGAEGRGRVSCGELADLGGGGWGLFIFQGRNVHQVDVSRQKLSPHCLETIFVSQLPSPKLSPKMPPKLSLAHKRGFFFSLSRNYPPPPVREIARQLRGKNGP